MHNFLLLVYRIRYRIRYRYRFRYRPFVPSFSRFLTGLS